MRKKVSVCLATYNGEEFIQEQIDSIISQLKDSDELIVSDDNSTDNTLKLVEGYNDARIKIIYNLGERGYSNNFENAINNASGEYIFLSDQDDVWMDDKIETMLSELENYDLVISDALISDSNLAPTLGSHFANNGTKRGFFNNWIKTRYIGACMAFNRTILTKLLPFPEKKKLCAHDYWIALVGEKYYKVKLIDKPLIKYRRHGKNASTGGEKSNNSFIHKILVRIYSLNQLLKRI